MAMSENNGKLNGDTKAYEQARAGRFREILEDMRQAQAEHNAAMDKAVRNIKVAGVLACIASAVLAGMSLANLSSLWNF